MFLSDGSYEYRQCSRNGLVCWCVDADGSKLSGSMGPADRVECEPTGKRASARSLGDSSCGEPLECAQLCQYGFKLDGHGCPTCECDDPCQGCVHSEYSSRRFSLEEFYNPYRLYRYPCPAGEECIVERENGCPDFLCPTRPQCAPKKTYQSPCASGAPLTDETGNAVTCTSRNDTAAEASDESADHDDQCPPEHDCTLVPDAARSVCCPVLPSARVAKQPTSKFFI